MTKMFEQRYLRLDGARIHYQSGGAGEPLVLLHGLSGSSRWWAHNVAALSERFHVYVVDLIGYGQSRGQRFSLHKAGALIGNLLDALAIERVNLMGHSMGGYIAGELAAHHPERVDRLVLVDALAVPVGRTLARSAVGLVESLRYLPMDFLPVLVGDALRAGPHTLARSILEIQQADLTSMLSHIQARTLIVWGEHDKLLPVERGEILHRALPLAEYRVVERAGHNPMWDQPEIFNQAVIAFLEQ